VVIWSSAVAFLLIEFTEEVQLLHPHRWIQFLDKVTPAEQDGSDDYLE
jgi:hypothetical protein